MDKSLQVQAFDMPLEVTADRALSYHVPAWKKLGLKLKIAVEEAPEDVKTLTSNIPANLKRKLDDDSIDRLSNLSSHASKNFKVSKVSSIKIKDLGHDNSARAQFDVVDSTELDSPTRTPAPIIERQKSVTFTPETKVEDGDSIKQLFANWVAEQKSQDPRFEPESFPVHRIRAICATAPSSVEAEPEVRRRQRDKKISCEKIPRESKSHPALEYLEHYLDRRETWKFNKSRQTYLLKHLFDIDKLPSRYNKALSAYVAGLQGKPARFRVLETAKHIRVEDEEAKPFAEESMESFAIAKADYNQALESFRARLRSHLEPADEGDRELDKIWQQRLAKRERAEMILWELENSGPSRTIGTSVHEETFRTTQMESERSTGGHAHSTADDDSLHGLVGDPWRRTKLNHGSSTHRNARRRKRGIGVPDDVSSSSDSSSSSCSTPSTGPLSDNSDDSGSSESSSSSEYTSSESDLLSSSESESDSNPDSGSESNNGGSGDESRNSNSSSST